MHELNGQIGNWARRVLRWPAGGSFAAGLMGLVLSLAAGPAGAQGELFTYSTEGAVHLRWNAPLGEAYQGFYVERQAAGGEWQRLNAEPIRRIDDVAEIRRLLGYSAEAFLTFFDPGTRTIDDAAFRNVASDPVALGMLELLSVKFARFGQVLGEAYSDRDLQPGTAFQYRVIGEVGGGTVDWAQTRAAVTHGEADRVPVPEGLAGEGGDGLVLLTWAHDDALSRSGQRVGYRVYRAGGPSGPFEIDSIETIIPAKIDGELPEFLYTSRFLENGMPYWFKLVGVNLLGFESAFTEAIKVVPKDAQPPSAPAGFRGRLQVETALLQWQASGEPDLEGYRLYRAEGPDGPWQQIWPAADEPLAPMISHVDTDVPEGAAFWYQVTAVDFSGNEGPPSDAVQLFRQDMTPPAQVQGLVARSVGEGQDAGIILSWEANSEADLQGYLVERTTRVRGEGEALEVEGDFFVETPQLLTETSYRDPVPKDSENRFAYRVVAIDQVWNRGEPSAFVIAQMPDIVPPNAPNLVYVRLERDTVRVAWTPNIERDLAGYRLMRAGPGGEFAAIGPQAIEPGTAEYSDRPADMDQVYRYQLEAFDEAGNVSAPSNVLSVRMIDLVGPPAPAIERIDSTETGLRVQWTAPPGGDVASLTLYRYSNQEEAPAVIAYLAPDAAEFVDSDVEQEVNYTYYLRASDAQRNLGVPGESATQSHRPQDKP
jgi:hypothetical protein